MGSLDYNPCLVVVLTKLGRTTPFTLLENTIEIAEIIKTAIETDLGNRVCAINKHTTGIAQTKVDNILAKIPPCVELKESTEG